MGGKINNLIGKRYGRLIVTDFAQKSNSGYTQWLTTCDCGNTKIILASNLNKPNGTKSCGCLLKEVTKTRMKPDDIFIGALFTTKRFGIVEVVEYKSFCDVIVKFTDGSIKSVAAKELRNGSVKNNFAPFVCGVGFIGDGEFPTQEYVNDKKRNTPAYEIWRGILRRCYDKNSHDRWPTYAGCSVDGIWHNFQEFAKWYYGQPNFGKGFHLDKDLTIPGNKVYGPDFCELIPPEVNSLFSGANKEKRGSCPLGVHFCNTKKLYIAQIHRGNSPAQDYLGTFNNKVDAFNAYKIAKEKYVKDVAERNKSVLSDAIYNNLVNYVVTEDD